MSKKNVKFGLTLLILSAFAANAFALWPMPKKKIIEYGMDSGDENYVSANITEMEKLPFDGIIFLLDGHIKAFDHENRWDPNDISRHCDTLRSIKWDKFRDNFLVLRVASDMDWYNDQHWDTIINNIKLFTKAVQAGRCKGICIDPEAYGHSPWAYDAENHVALHRKTISYQDYCKQVRKRGREYMQAIQSVKPDIKIMTLLQLSEYYNMLSNSSHSASTAAGDLEKHYYAMLYAFFNGMLDAAGPEIVFIDGNENAYYYTNAGQFNRSYVDIKQRFRYLVAPENRVRYASQLQVGSGLYTDVYFGILPWPADALGSFLTPEQRLKYFELVLYCSMDTADEYVWVYSEGIDWWRNRNVPQGALDVMRTVKQMVNAGEKMTFNMDETIAGAQARQKQVLFGAVEPRKTEICRIPADNKPVIDGKLDDAFWASTKPLEGFVPINRMMKNQVNIQTEARLGWDDEYLYVAMKCIEPNVKQIGIAGDKRDGGVWGGDVVEVFLCPSMKTRPIYHCALNPANTQCDAITEKDEEVKSWDAAWKSAVSINKDNWIVELAISWKDVGGAPKIGEQRRANLTRQRDPKPKELSSWTPLKRYFHESENYGIWIFTDGN